MIYIPYCKNKHTSDKTRAEHDKFFLQRQTELGHRLGIDDLLIAPVQRFTKYQLLLKVRVWGQVFEGSFGCMCMKDWPYKCFYRCGTDGGT